MIRLFKVLSTLSVLSLVVACGESPLTDAQKAEIKSLTHSANSVASATKNSRSGGTTALAKGDTESPEAQLSAKLSNCDFKTPEASEGAALLSMNMKVSGATCPITMEFNIAATKVGDNGGSATIKLFYEIVDKELAALLDVTRMDISGTISGSGGSGGGQIKGTMTSKKFGNVDITMDITGNSGGVKTEVTYGMKGYKAKFGVEQNGEEVKYTVQGKSVSLAELKDYLDGGSLIPGMAAQTAESSSDKSSSNNSFTYTLEFNGCSTGKQTFSSQAALCEGLKDDSLNKGCAEQMRRDRFTADKCSGLFN